MVLAAQKVIVVSASTKEEHSAPPHTWGSGREWPLTWQIKSTEPESNQGDHIWKFAECLTIMVICARGTNAILQDHKM